MSNCVFGGIYTDVYVNGQLAMNGDRPLSNVQDLEITGYLYLEPGTYSVALTPTNGSLDNALLGPLDVTIEAGHRYTVVMLGQADETSHTPLIIDETAAYQAAGVKPTDAAHITINNVKGADGISFLQGSLDDIPAASGEREVPFGSFSASVMPTTFDYFEITLSGKEGGSSGNITDSYNLAGSDWLDCFGGSSPAANDSFSSASNSELNAMDFLQLQTDQGIHDGDHNFAFSTFLAAVKKAGLTELLSNDNPFFLFAPTDEAFAKLPKEQLDALMADPEALVNLLRSHIAPGFYPVGSLGRQNYNDRTVTSLNGTPISLLGGGKFTINGVRMAGHYTRNIVKNGSQVVFVTSLLWPPK
jgi:uncharacterized surface protein with fasciclin (FAS1) repeats